MIDAHTHLASEAFLEDREDCILRLKENKIQKVNLIGESKEAAEMNSMLKQNDPHLFDLSVGLHPQMIQDYSQEEISWMKQQIFNPQTQIIGEIGLDYHWYPEQKELQKKWFIQQIEWANQLQKPIMIHCREAIEDTIEILKQYPPQYGCVFHSYSGSVETAKILTKWGCLLSIGGVLTFKNAQKVKEVVKEIDTKFLLCETDAPYLTPTPFRGKRNEPSYVKYVYEMMADLKGINIDELKQIIADNYDQYIHKKRPIIIK